MHRMSLRKMPNCVVPLRLQLAHRTAVPFFFRPSAAGGGGHDQSHCAPLAQWLRCFCRWLWPVTEATHVAGCPWPRMHGFTGNPLGFSWIMVVQMVIFKHLQAYVTSFQSHKISRWPLGGNLPLKYEKAISSEGHHSWCSSKLSQQSLRITKGAGTRSRRPCEMFQWHHQKLTRLADWKLQPSNFFSGFLATVPCGVSFATFGLENGFGGTPVYANVRCMLHVHNIKSPHRIV